MAGPAAFMSYVRFDDAHEDGQLSAFRERLAGEIRIQTGREFPIFQDRNDIAWGQNWRQRIEETLDEVTLLLVIVTPGLFQSPACRDEVARFRERERSSDARRPDPAGVLRQRHGDGRPGPSRRRTTWRACCGRGSTRTGGSCGSSR